MSGHMCSIFCELILLQVLSNLKIENRMMVDGANEEDGTGIEHDMEAMNDEEEVVYEEDDVIHPPIANNIILACFIKYICSKKPFPVIPPNKTLILESENIIITKYTNTYMHQLAIYLSCQ